MLNGLEKHMNFTINNNWVFIDSMQFINSSLNKLAKQLSDSDFNIYVKNLVVFY